MKRPPTLTAEFCNCKPDQIFHNPYFVRPSYYLFCTVWDTVHLDIPTVVLLIHTSENIQNHSLESSLPLQKSVTSYNTCQRILYSKSTDIIVTVTCTQFS